MKLKRILEHRSIWLGFAMIWIVLFHSGVQLSFAPFSMFKRIGYGGVDICFLDRELAVIFL